jgi:hypothetical protein
MMVPKELKVNGAASNAPRSLQRLVFVAGLSQVNGSYRLGHMLSKVGKLPLIVHACVSLAFRMLGGEAITASEHSAGR